MCSMSQSMVFIVLFAYAIFILIYKGYIYTCTAIIALLEESRVLVARCAAVESPVLVYSGWKCRYSCNNEFVETGGNHDSKAFKQTCL